MEKLERSLAAVEDELSLKRNEVRERGKGGIERSREREGGRERGRERERERGREGGREGGREPHPPGGSSSGRVSGPAGDRL